MKNNTAKHVATTDAPEYMVQDEVLAQIDGMTSHRRIRPAHRAETPTSIAPLRAASHVSGYRGDTSTPAALLPAMPWVGGAL